MAGIKDYSTTNLNNTSLNGISVAEGMLPSQLNNAIRALMVNTRSWYNDSQWVEYGDGDGAYTAAYASATSFTIAGVDVTPIYHEGRRIKLTASTPGTIYGTISSSSFSIDTTINVTWDSGSLSNEAIDNVYIGALSKTNNSLPTGVIATATLADGSVTTIKIADSAVTTAKINDAAVTNAKLGADSVDGSKIADDSIDSEHYVDGSIDTSHIADSQITTAKIADSNVTNSKLATDSVTTAKITNLNVTSGKIADASISNSKIASDAVDGTKIADDSINSEHYADGSIDTQHIADSQITTSKIADSNVTTSKIADSNITTSKINNDAVTADKIADAVIVTNAEASGHTPNDTTFFTTSASDGRYFRQDSSETISSGDTWSDSDSFIATTAAIDDRIIDLVDEVGGFVAIANEDSFPTTNPDINDGTGTIVSIADAGGMTYNTGTGVSTDAQTTGATTVTINSIPAGIGSPIPNGYGMLVETTTTLNTYTFHRLVPIATEVTTVASVSSDITTVAGQISPTNNISTVAGISSDVQTLADIEDGTVATNAISNVGNNISSVVTTASNISGVNSFADRYRVSATAPTTSLDIGDLYYDTATDAMKVYGSSGWQNAGSSVNGTSQRYNYTATSGQTTFTGADNNGNTLTYDAGYIDVYLNGVKLLNGTDVTVTSGSSVVLASGATTGDVVDIVAYGTFSVASLNADNLDSGTVPSARISGAYTGITEVGTLNGIDVTGTVVSDTIELDGAPNAFGTNTSNAYIVKTGSTGSAPFNQAGALLYQPRTSAIEGRSNHLFYTGSPLALRQNIHPNGDISFYEDTGTTPKFYWDASTERLGIGTSSPSTKLDINGSARVSTGSAYQFGGSDYKIEGSNVTNPRIGFITNSSEAMRIDSSGNLLVGKTTVTSPATTQGIHFTSNGVGHFTRDGNHALQVCRLTDDGNFVSFRKDGTAVGTIGSYLGSYLYMGSPGGIDTHINFVNGNVRPATSTGAHLDNSLALGHSQSRWSDVYVGGGVYLGGTGTANKLDDYEEGTFTPILKGSPSPTSITYSHQVGKYTKVGNKVTVNYYLETTAYSGGGGTLELDGLPFTVASNTYNWSVGSITFYAVAQFNETVARANANTTYLTVFGRDTLTTSGTWSNKNLSDWKTSGTSAVMATVTYFTD